MPLPHKNADNEYFVHTDFGFFNKEKRASVERELAEHKLQTEELENEIRRLQRGFSYLICYKDLIDFETTNPSVLSYWDDKSKQDETCKVNAQVICEIMDLIEKNPDYDIETLRQAYDSYKYLPSYLPPKGKEGVVYYTAIRENIELLNAAEDLIKKRERENEEAELRPEGLTQA